MVLDGPEEVRFRYKRKEGTVEWHKLKEIKFEGKDPIEIENYAESITIEKDMTILEDEYIQKTIWKQKIPTQEKPVTITSVIEKLANEGMRIMYDFLKKHFLGRIYRKPMNLEEFFEDMLYYFKEQQTRRYVQDWEERLYNTVKEIDPDIEYKEFTTKKRIKQLGEMGIKLKVYKRLTTKQALKKKEEELEKEIERKTKHMNPIQAFIYRDKFMKEQREERVQSYLQNEITKRLLNIHLKDEEGEIDKEQSMIWEEFKKEGKRLGIHEMKRKVQKWLGRGKVT
jgi:hypothetical protein